MSLTSYTPYASSGSATTHTGTLTLGSSLTGKVIVGVLFENALDVTGVTFDGASMTLDRTYDRTASLKARLYILDVSGKGAGTYNVAATFSGSAGTVGMVFWTATGRASGTSEASGTSDTSGVAATLTATALADLIAININSSGTATLTFTGDVTERVDQNVQANCTIGAGDAEAVSAGTRTATVTATAGTNGLLLASYANASAPSTVLRPWMI